MVLRGDCETNAVKRLLPALRREHPHLKMTVLLDGLHGKALQVRLLRVLGMNFVIGGRRADHEALHGQIEVDGETHEFRDPNGTVHRFRWRNGRRRTTATGIFWSTRWSMCRPRQPTRSARRTVRLRTTLQRRMRANLVAVFLTGWEHLMQRTADNRTRSPPTAVA